MENRIQFRAGDCRLRLFEPDPRASDDNRSAKRDLTMKIRSVMLSIIFVLLGLLASPAQDAAAKTDPNGDKFKREMLPRVGQRITFVGTVNPGKFGPWLTSDRWNGIYVEAVTTNSFELTKVFAKMNRLGRMEGQELKVEGVLHFNPGHDGLKVKGVQAPGIPEHFFFDVSEISWSTTKPGSDESPKK